MATTSITITDDAYNFLKSIKGKRSFSETILDLKSCRGNIMKYAGALKESGLKGAENAREHINRDWADRR